MLQSKFQSVLVPMYAEFITLVIPVHYSNICQCWHGTSDSLEQIFSQENVPLSTQPLNYIITGYDKVSKLMNKTEQANTVLVNLVSKYTCYNNQRTQTFPKTHRITHPPTKNVLH